MLLSICKQQWPQPSPKIQIAVWHYPFKIISYLQLFKMIIFLPYFSEKTIEFIKITKYVYFEKFPPERILIRYMYFSWSNDTAFVPKSFSLFGIEVEILIVRNMIFRWTLNYMHRQAWTLNPCRLMVIRWWVLNAYVILIAEKVWYKFVKRLWI